MAIVRPLGVPMPTTHYNSQEIGLARGLSRLGIDVDIFVAGSTRDVRYQSVPGVGSGVVTVVQLPFYLVPNVRQAIFPGLLRQLAQRSYDFIQVNETNEITSFSVVRFAAARRIPVSIYQGMYEPISGRVQAAFQWIFDRTLLPTIRRKSSAVLAKTERARTYLLNQRGFSRVDVLPVGLDPSPFNDETPHDWRQELAIPPSNQVILYVGVFEKRRNVHFLIDLAKRLSSANVTLIMAGTGPLLDQLTQRLTDESIDNVRLVGAVPQSALPSLYRTSEVFLLPSDYEIYGMVVLEAMYFGVPVISSRTAGPEDIISSGDDGVVLDTMELDNWESTVLRILQDRSYRRQMSDNARSKIHDSLLWDHIAHRYLRTHIAPTLT